MTAEAALVPGGQYHTILDVASYGLRGRADSPEASAGRLRADAGQVQPRCRSHVPRGTQQTADKQLVEAPGLEKAASWESSVTPGKCVNCWSL